MNYKQLGEWLQSFNWAQSMAPVTVYLPREDKYVPLWDTSFTVGKRDDIEDDRPIFILDNAISLPPISDSGSP